MAQLIHNRREAGSYILNWDGRDTAGKSLATGVYVCRLQAGHRTLSSKLLLLR